MAIVLSCINLKGGVGKTALAVNFSAFCGRKGLRTLLVDLDPQTNATFSTIGVAKWSDISSNGTVADLLGVRNHTRAEESKVNASDVIIKDVYPNVDLIPSHIDLFTVDLDLASVPFRETKLKNALKSEMENYDIVVCDCPPNLTIPTQNALAFSSHYIVPVSLDFLSAIGVGLLLNRVNEFGKDLDQELTLAGIIISRVGRPAVHREETELTLREQLKEDVLEAVIKERVAISKSAQQNISVFDSGDTSAISEFTEVCEEIVSRVGLQI